MQAFSLYCPVKRCPLSLFQSHKGSLVGHDTSRSSFYPTESGLDRKDNLRVALCSMTTTAIPFARSAMPGIRYIRCRDDTGWLKIRLTAPMGDVSVCEHTKVEFTREVDGRRFFKIADGSSDYVGKEASLTAAHARQYLADSGPGSAAKVEVKYEGEPSTARTLLRVTCKNLRKGCASWF